MQIRHKRCRAVHFQVVIFRYTGTVSLHVFTAAAFTLEDVGSFEGPSHRSQAKSASLAFSLSFFDALVALDMVLIFRTRCFPALVSTSLLYQYLIALIHLRRVKYCATKHVIIGHWVSTYTEDTELSS